MNVALLNNAVTEFSPESSVPLKNAAVAERIAGILGGRVCEVEDIGDDPYLVPVEPIPRAIAAEYKVTGDGDVYGAVVEHSRHGEKTMLHRLVSPDAHRPEWYSPDFAREVGGVVLPGFTVFTPEDAYEAYSRCLGGSMQPRFKDPEGICERGQYILEAKADLDQALTDMGDTIFQTGAVIEANLWGARTITVGTVTLDGEQYSWHGAPTSQHTFTADTRSSSPFGLPPPAGLKRFSSNVLTVVRGGIGELAHHTDGNLLKSQAIQQIAKVHAAYGTIGATVSRATYDAVHGLDTKGEYRLGVTDPSLRPSASSPAEILAIEELRKDSSLESICTRVAYDYGTGPVAWVDRHNGVHSAQLGWKNQELFACNDKMNIFVGVVDGKLVSREW